MFNVFCAPLLCVLLLAGCAGAPIAATPPELQWPDRQFGYPGSAPALKGDDLFALDKGLAARLPLQRGTADHQGHERILKALFGDGRFTYSAGPSTTAAQTWRDHSGDCLSLAILTVAAARALGIDAYVQEVEIPDFYERRGQLDYAYQHVNVVFPRSRVRISEEDNLAGDVVVDFDVQLKSSRRGLRLSEQAVRARFHSNLAVHYLATGRPQLAYAELRTAVDADPQYVGSYVNLSVLYSANGMQALADAVLAEALRRNPQERLAMRLLANSYAEQGRVAEAESLRARLQRLRDNDPYLLIASGISRLKVGDNRQAVKDLERALRTTSGFVELHRSLAIAYSRTGDIDRAREQREIVARLEQLSAAASGAPKKPAAEPH